MPVTIVTAATALRRGGTTSRALVEASLAAIARYQPETNAFTRITAERARQEALTADEDFARGMDRGPLQGIPVSVKDLIDEAGEVTTAGSRVLDDRIAETDAIIVRRLRAAGAVLIGRTNLHEFALGTTSEDSAFGPVRHPADPTRSAGGSSGGSAAAVATGMGLASVGTDTGGSVRIPAAACGLVGIKPSKGEVPTDGVIPLSVTFDHIGPLALTVQDASWMLDVVAGRTPATVVASQPAAIRLKRLVGYFDVIEPAVRTAFDAALARLEARGARVTPETLPLTDLITKSYTSIVLAEGAHWHAPYLDTRADAYVPAVRARLLAGRDVPAVAYLDALVVCARLHDAIDRTLDDCDALILPTLPIVAPLLGGGDIRIDPARPDTMPVRAAMLKHTQPFNLSGHPAIALPVPSASLPVSLQLVGRIDQTAALLAVAAACERALDTSAE